MSAYRLAIVWRILGERSYISDDPSILPFSSLIAYAEDQSRLCKLGWYKDNLKSISMIQGALVVACLHLSFFL